ncbi:Lpp/OprI family alanine-zipper lipoprotein [Thalassotalea mangrovi]|uniref:Major outer membrane lipoprotein Lpp n=1 Tax=Thalassotalea mangrovi TaxID=2572245 RepID=A0A4U1B971_9GAMM|nr:Lpp/OprI family alanine-zipper lipoprotein [Thalassotalea mangrovi]TKB47052.1 hypothetical protein E8M12_01985 [Thalassotalea mangrovi]
MKNKMMTLAGMVFALGLAGCSSNEMLEKNVADLNMKVDNLSAQVDSLSSEVADLKVQQQQATADAMAAKEMAAEANERVDNVVESYKK